MSRDSVQLLFHIRRFDFMKKVMMFAFAVLLCAGAALAQGSGYTQGTGITGIDKLGAHQNGGRGCVGCHTPHSGARGNGGTMQWDATANGGAGAFVSAATEGDVGNEALWGQDLGPLVGLGTITTGSDYPVDLTEMETRPRIKTGVVICLSCHDGNVAKGAMMTNQSFEQTAGLLPDSYGGQPIPTLLGFDGGTAGNYANDHPIGPAANIGALGTIGPYLDLNATKSKVITGAGFAGSPYETFQQNYGLPTILGRSGFVVESTMATVDDAYVVCTTCHTPHSMYTASASGSNPIAGLTEGTFPSYFFISAPYNPAADTANGAKASSATQFCRQCHFTHAGGSNEGSGIMGIQTAF
jgi:hypothetical protein